MINAVTCYYDSSDLSNHFEIQGIKSFRFHSQFGAEGPLKFGGAYASSIEFEYYINSQRDLNTGDALVHYQKFERSQTDFHLLPEGTYRTIFNNVFYVYSFEKNKNVARVVAYDAIKFLDIDYSKRLSSIESNFPMTIYDLLQDVFSYSGCNVSLPLFNYDLKFTPVDYFYVEKITARTIVSCIAELNGNNLLASTEDNAPFTPKISFSAYSGYAGQIVGYPEYSRYGAKNYIIAPTDQDTYIVDNVQLIPAFYKENSLEVGTDEYKEIDCVKAIKLNGDVVASYGNTENNVYYVRNNVIVENVSSMTNNAISTLYNEARVIDATPAVKVNLFPFRCPFVIRGITYFVDTDGSIKKLPIMSMDWTESHVIVQSFGTSVQDYSEYSFQNVEEQNTSIVSVLNKLESDLNDKVSKSGDTMTGALNLDVPLAIASGGTGASSAANARTNLGLGSVATESIVPLAKGGTGETTANDALVALNGLSKLTAYYTNDVIDTMTDGTALLRTSSLANTSLYNALGDNYAYVVQIFYSAIGSTRNRMQLAFPYGKTINKIAWREYNSATSPDWGDWHVIRNGTDSVTGITVPQSAAGIATMPTVSAVRNGNIVQVAVSNITLAASPPSVWANIATGLPIPSEVFYTHFIAANGSSTKQLRVRVSTSGQLQVAYGQGSATYASCFTYVCND